MKILWNQSESNAPLEMDKLQEAKEVAAAFFKKLREELEEDCEDEEE